MIPEHLLHFIWRFRLFDQASLLIHSGESLEIITRSLSSNYNAFPWLEWNNDTMSGSFISAPERSQVPENIKEQLIVELYSR